MGTNNTILQTAIVQRYDEIIGMLEDPKVPDDLKRKIHNVSSVLKHAKAGRGFSFSDKSDMETCRRLLMEIDAWKESK